jgi:hypothetical protein
MAGKTLASAVLGVLLGLWTAFPTAQAAGAPVYQSFLDLPDPETVMFRDGLDSGELVGSTVVAPDGARVGTVTDLLVGPSGQVDKAALDAGSALGAGSRHVAVEIDRLRRTEAGAGTLLLEASVAELKALPAYRQVDNRWEPIR